ncbi:rod shape-determining protein MreC [Niabella drilacis]|uniref:rod shape-determining protein MreC n=1 Tax=Niabella drilacis (strain DSM 25811 / CCM 8410 / CCUG 62505 / LMG 26954 / E90) TaxID=1285928 RepID=UPI001FE1AF4A|nr:rod shape-determining protein MreC [Niabella drilacis]
MYNLFTYNRLHRVKGLEAAGRVTSYFNSKYNSLEDFFRMQAENKRVHQMNDSLLNLMQANFVQIDTNAILVHDTAAVDTTGKARRYLWRPAQVLYATVNSDKNYLQINRGTSSGIGNDMGVFSSNGGLVGKVVNAGKDFSEVMTLLHVMNKLSVQLKKTGNSGIISWDGKMPTELTLNGIPKTDSVRLGDTILTGNYSLSYPPGKMVGTVSRVLKDEATNFFILKIKPAANFGSLQQVFVVENLNYEALQQLGEETGRKVEAKSGNK